MSQSSSYSEIQNSVNMIDLMKAFLMDEIGRDVPIHKLWQNQKAIFIFLRHFACIACRVHAREIWKKRKYYEKTGAKLYFVGSGGVNYIESFKKEHGITDRVVYTDLTLDCFRAAGFKRGFLAAYGPKSTANIVKMVVAGDELKRENYGEGMGDKWQLGGALAIAQNGQILYHFISEAVGDFPPEKDDPQIRGDAPSNEEAS